MNFCSVVQGDWPIEVLVDNGDSIGRALPAQLLSQDAQKVGFSCIHCASLLRVALLLWDLTGSYAKPVQSQLKITIN